MVVYMYMHNRGSGCFGRLFQAQSTVAQCITKYRITCYVPLLYKIIMCKTHVEKSEINGEDIVNERNACENYVEIEENKEMEMK